MAAVAEVTTYSSLADKLAALEQKFAELEKKYIGTPVTAEALALLDKAKDIAKEAEQDVKSVDNAKEINKEPEDKGSDPRIKVVVRRRNPETGMPIEEDSKLQKSKQEDQTSRAFILRKNIWDDKFKQFSQINNSEIDIINPGLWDLLKRHLGSYPSHYFRDSPVTLRSPYEPIIFHFDELDAASRHGNEGESEADRLAREDLARLLHVISGGDSGDTKLDNYFKMRPIYKKPLAQNEPETIQFQDLWTVFAPGTLIYGQPFQNEHQVFVVKENAGTWPDSSRYRTGGRNYDPWRLYAWTYDWKDDTFRRTDFLLTIEEFDGHVPLTSLSYYPFKLRPDHSAIQKELIARGKNFRQICEAKDGQLFDYDGYVIAEHKGFSGMKRDSESGIISDWTSTTTHDVSDLMRLYAGGLGIQQSRSRMPTAKSTEVRRNRVMVDYNSYFQYAHSDGRNGALEPANTGPGCLCSDCQSNEGLDKRYRFRFDKITRQQDWEDEQYLICPPRVLGYVLADKKWAQLQVTKLTAITSSTEEFTAEFDRLRLADDIDYNDHRARQNSRRRTDNTTKKLLLDLVRHHTGERKSGSKQQELEVDDIIPGKGKGLVVLLYGPPGVGKTSTAEMMAIATQKPLFSVSVADVGTDAKHVEANLSKIFALASKWQAILLIDEADVFLESRARGAKVQSADKNALVSVFLRVLEYYHGIMFLTTNQIAQFDIAIVSRIHIAIRYETLKPPQTEAIFRNFLDELDKRNAIEDYDEPDGILDWVRDISKDELDGRQIRNIVTTALGLARAANVDKKGGKLTKGHLIRAHKNVYDFKKEFALQMSRYKDSQDKMIR